MHTTQSSESTNARQDYLPRIHGPPGYYSWTDFLRDGLRLGRFSTERQFHHHNIDLLLRELLGKSETHFQFVSENPCFWGITFRFDFDNDKLVTVEDLQLLMIHIIPCINNNNGVGHSQNLEQRLFEHRQVKDYLNASIPQKD
jgi:hypothetical protein